MQKNCFFFLLSLFFLGLMPQKSNAGFFDFISDGANMPGPLRDYEKDRAIMRSFPYWTFNNDDYKNAGVFDEDLRLKETCFKGVPEQDLSAVNEEDKQSTLGSELGVIQGAQPIGCMPMKVTKRFSPLELSPWYLISLMNPNYPAIREPYQLPGGLNEGNPYRGGSNPIRHRQRMVLPTPTMQVGCAFELMVEPSTGNADPYDPVWMRRELDNCTNQYILQQARFLRDPDDPSGEYFGVNTGLCQPFRLELPPTKHELYEYVPTEYIGIAWIKLLMDSQYTARNNRSAAEPNYYRMTKVKVQKQIPIPADKFGLILVEDLAEKDPINLQFEKILDPSHPYSPRWDFERTDWSHSPVTALYGGNPVNGVRCSDTVPVDLLKFREPMFEKWVKKKIFFNIFCYNNYWCRKYIWYPLGCSGAEPCCATQYNQTDKFRNKFGPAVARRICGVPMHEVCNYVARPLTGLNTLKLREATPLNFPQGVPEGYGFRDYFGLHKPYMRCWDTNTECGESSQTFSENVGSVGSYDFTYNPNSVRGAFYAVMGAGREGESCTIGGGLGAGGVANPDPISSWSELKLYYVRAQRMGSKCLGLEPKMFKSYGTEEFILSRGGAEWQKKMLDTKGRFSRYRSFKWNFGWRGYVSDPIRARRFPNLGGGSPSIQFGLDEAIPGEVLVFDQDVVMTGAAGTWRNPYVAFVTNVANQRMRREIKNGAIAATLDPEEDFVKAIAHNHGKYVDACGNTDDLGMGEEYTMFKGKLPPPYPRLLSEAGLHTTECDDPRMSACVEPLWNSVKRYYIKDNIRN